MRITLALAALAASLLAVPAAADPPFGEPYGQRCNWASVNDPRGDGDTQVAELDAELVVLDAAGRPASGTLTCSIQAGYYRHDEPDVASASVAGTGVVVLATTVSFAADPQLPYYWCTRFVYDGGPTLYWAREYPDKDSHWSTDPTSSCDYYSYEDPRPIGEVLDDYLCPVLAGLHDALPLTDPAGPVYIDEQGDTYLAGTFFWDCPPYE